MSDAPRHTGFAGSPADRELLDRLRPALTLVASTPSEFAVHVAHTVELVGPRLIVRVGTGWDTFVEVAAGGGPHARPGDRLVAIDWGIDNFGPEGQVVDFNGGRVLDVGNRPPGPVDGAAVAAARRFARALVELTEAPSFSALMVAMALFPDDDDEGAAWRAGNLAASAVDGAVVRAWAER